MPRVPTGYGRCVGCGVGPGKLHHAGCPKAPTEPTCPACDARLTWERAHYSCPQCHLIVLACCDGDQGSGA